MPPPVPGFDPRATVLFTIAAGASLSNGRDLAGFVPAMIFMPSAWDAAAITCQVSEDGITWLNAYDAGTEMSLTVAASRAQILTASAFNAFPGPWWRLRSGTAATPVAQTAAAILRVLCRPIG